MENSKLVSVTILSPNNSGRRTHSVDRISPHCMVGQLSAKKCGELFSRRSYEASSNYGIGKDGEIGLYVPEEKRSWCSSNADNDNRAITIECASDARHPYAMNNRVWKSLVALCVDICRRYGKTKLIWFGSKSKSLSYKPADNEMIITVHRWFAQKSCPGDWLYNRLGKLASEVTAQLGGKSEVHSGDQQPQTTSVLYRVQCGAFANKENAEKLVKTLKKAGFEAKIMEG
ncbi:MAG: N-acetylmuramoyl-L-alanine amidase [Eubacteriales bacterium]|nr:N-acetylmuramoyl-L-alanine amidase [Eubacteriales bacterium]